MQAHISSKSLGHADVVNWNLRMYLAEGIVGNSLFLLLTHCNLNVPLPVEPYGFNRSCSHASPAGGALARGDAGVGSRLD